MLILVPKNAPFTKTLITKISSLLRVYWTLTSCKKSEKIKELIVRNQPYRLTARQTSNWQVLGGQMMYGRTKDRWTDGWMQLQSQNSMVSKYSLQSSVVCKLLILNLNIDKLNFLVISWRLLTFVCSNAANSKVWL